MTNPKEISIPVSELPTEYVAALTPFTNLVTENGHYGTLTAEDFEVASNTESKTESYCKAFAELKGLLLVDSQNSCADLMADVPVILDRLQSMVQAGKITENTIKPSPSWSVEDRLAALEYVGRVLWTYYLEEEKLPEPYGDFKPKLMITKTGGGETVISGEVFWDGRVQKLDISFVPTRLDSGKSISMNFTIKIGEQELPPEKWPDILPDVLTATEKWNHRFCRWGLFDGGLILFDYDQHKLNERAEAYLTVLSDFMKNNPALRLEIYGYADSAGTNAHNLELGARRARSVGDFLIRKGIAKERLITVSKGESEPVDASADDQSNIYNRNVRLKIFRLDGNAKNYSLCYGPQAGIVTGGCNKITLKCGTPTQSSDPVYK